jgi:hypothetical protein
MGQIGKFPNPKRTLQIPVQRAGCALLSMDLQEPTEIIQLIEYPTAVFNLSPFSEGSVP